MPAPPARLLEKRGNPRLQLRSAARLVAWLVFRVLATEQPVQILPQTTHTLPHGGRIAEQQQQPRTRANLVAGDGLNQAVQQFNWNDFTAMHARRQHQIEP